jgi:HSP20 family protein
MQRRRSPGRGEKRPSGSSGRHLVAAKLRNISSNPRHDRSLERRSVAAKKEHAMDIRSLMPFRRAPAVSRRTGSADLFAAFRDEMNRAFDEFFAGVGFPLLGSPSAGNAPALLTPQMDVSETDKEIHIAVDLPGLEAEDIELTLDDDILTISGEKAAQREEDERDYHVIERLEGTFSRSIRLPFEIDPAQVQAVFKDGVLEIAIPKPAEAHQKRRRIGVKREGEAKGARISGVDQAAAGDKPSSAQPS